MYSRNKVAPQEISDVPKNIVNRHKSAYQEYHREYQAKQEENKKKINNMNGLFPSKNADKLSLERNREEKYGKSGSKISNYYRQSSIHPVPETSIEYLKQVKEKRQNGMRGGSKKRKPSINGSKFKNKTKNRTHKKH